MEIEYVEESRLHVHTVRVNGQFWGIVVHKDTDNFYVIEHEIHKFTGKGFELIDTVRRSGLIGAVIRKELEN